MNGPAIPVPIEPVEYRHQNESILVWFSRYKEQCCRWNQRRLKSEWSYRAITNDGRFCTVRLKLRLSRLDHQTCGHKKLKCAFDLVDMSMLL